MYLARAQNAVDGAEESRITAQSMAEVDTMTWSQGDKLHPSTPVCDPAIAAPALVAAQRVTAIQGKLSAPLDQLLTNSSAASTKKCEQRSVGGFCKLPHERSSSIVNAAQSRCRSMLHHWSAAGAPVRARWAQARASGSLARGARA